MSDLKKSIVISLISTMVACTVCISAFVFFFDGQNKTGKKDGDTVLDEEYNTVEKIKELTIVSSEESEDFVIVETSYVTLKYPRSFSDLIGIEALNHGAYSELRFFADIRGNRAELYSLFFEHSAGHTVGTLVLDETDRELSVTVDFYEPGDNLIPDDHITFYASQETANDVIVSLEENDNFIGEYIRE